jgi:hypothetical protein
MLSDANDVELDNCVASVLILSRASLGFEVLYESVMAAPHLLVRLMLWRACLVCE